MPELPEVETVARQLNNSLLNRVINKVIVYRDKIFTGDSLGLYGKKVQKVGRKAKMIEIEFDGFESLVQIHLKMTGQLIFVDGEKRVVGGHPTSDWVKQLPNKFTRVEVLFADGSTLFFNDMRAFGWVRVVTKIQELRDSKARAPDVVDEGFSLEYFKKVLSKYSRPIKVVLLDQKLMGGIGNIYANDALNMSKISPTKKAKELTSSEVEKLYNSVKFVINLGIESGGASASNYVDTKGMGGTYQNHFLTYKREGMPCKNCGDKIVKIKLGGRGTFYCPGCQK